MHYKLPGTRTPTPDRDGALRRAVSAARRILVLGSPGSGKTYLSRELARVLELEHVELDDHFWETPTRWMSPQLWRPYVSNLVSADEWLIDGTYESTLDLRVPEAQLAIVIEEGRMTCLQRVVRRRLALVLSGHGQLAPGQHLDRRFLTYVWRYPRHVRPLVWQSLSERRDTVSVVELTGKTGTRALLDIFR